MYGFETTMSGSVDNAIPQVREGLAREGFGVLFDIDVQSIRKAKLGIDSRPYRILGACSPPHAHLALSADPNIGLLLPCNVVVREEDDGRVTVAFMDPREVLTLVGKPEIAPVAAEVRAALMRVCEALGK